MARLTAPALGFQARGSLGPAITLRRRKRQTIAELRPIPTDARTPAQLSHRQVFHTGTTWWHTLTPASEEAYRLLNPKIGYNAAYLNFMKEWLMTEIVAHQEQHQHGGGDPLSIQHQDSASLGPSATPLLNLTIPTAPITVLTLVTVSSTDVITLDLSPWLPSATRAIFLNAAFRDSGSSLNQTYIHFRRSVDWPLPRVVGPHLNNFWNNLNFFLPTTDTPSIQYQLIASGVDTGSAVLKIIGWLEIAQV